MKTFVNKFIDEVIGKSPIHPVILIIGKLSFLVCLLFFAFKRMSPGIMQYDSRVASVIGLFLLAAGICLISAAMIQLGQSLAVGIPEKETKLKTHGLYRFSRNPIYLSAYLMCVGSCLYAVHWINFVFFAVAVTIHHAIIKKEEAFLERTFGAEWNEYKKRVPRYIMFL